MFERYTLSSTYFPSQTFDETGCDYLVFPTPGKKDSVTVDIYYSLEEGEGIYTQEVNLLNFKAHYDLPSWYPIFQLPYEIDVYIEIIYIDSSPDPDIFAPHAYHEPRHEFLRHLYDDIDNTNYISDH